MPLSGGTASISNSSLPAGADTITATYSGDTDFSGSTGSLTQGVIGVLTVQNNLDSGSGSLRAAIADAVSGDTIEFAAGLAGDTITLDSTLTINTSLQIEGLGASELTISGNNSCEVFDFSSSTATVGISGLTITDGNAQYGGGIYNSSLLTLTGCTVSDNSASRDGAGIYIDSTGGTSGTLNVTDSTISGNAAGEYGGAIDVYGYMSGTYTVTIMGSTLSGNRRVRPVAPLKIAPRW